MGTAGNTGIVVNVGNTGEVGKSTDHYTFYRMVPIMRITTCRMHSSTCSAFYRFLDCVYTVPVRASTESTFPSDEEVKCSKSDTAEGNNNTLYDSVYH